MTEPASERTDWDSKGKRNDLTNTRFPVADAEAWKQPEQALKELYDFSEKRAMQASEWYLRDKRGKRLGSQILRILAVVFGAFGGLAPLGQLIFPGVPLASLGYVFIVLAAAAVAYDKFFGLSAAWMRDIVASQQISSHLSDFQFRWARLSIEERSSGSVTTLQKLELAWELSSKVDKSIQAETLTWESEFRALVAQLQQEREQAASGQQGGGA